MTRYVIAARLGAQDTALVETSGDEQLVNVEFLDDAGVLRHGIGRALRDLGKMELLAGVNNFFRSRHLFLSGRASSAAVHLQ